MPEAGLGYVVVDDRAGLERVTAAVPHWPAHTLVKVGDRWRQDKQIDLSVWGYLFTRREDGQVFVHKVGRGDKEGITWQQQVDYAKKDLEERMKR